MFFFLNITWILQKVCKFLKGFAQYFKNIKNNYFVFLIREIMNLYIRQFLILNKKIKISLLKKAYIQP